MNERNHNIDLALTTVKSQSETDIEIIKEQMIDLQDKFDYVLSMMMNNQIISKGEKDFKMGQGNYSI